MTAAGQGNGVTTLNASNAGGTSNAPGWWLRSPCPFVGTDGRIYSSNHADGLIRVLQLASGTSPGGVVAALGHSN
jgi:hypothetical protein